MENTAGQSFEYAKSGLSEDAVKQRFVPFLKDFYRHRYEPAADSFRVNLDNVSEGGLVADILMTFKKSDDSPFVCACEATSRDKVGEVKFALNIVYFLWDAAAFGAACATATYAFFYKTRLEWLLDLHWIGNLGLVLGVFMIGFFGWYFTLQGWRKYRYIYAIEQFKRYGADDQWVALAEDVFPAPNDPYLAELKSQCIYNGFGLALVPAEGAVRVLNAPSRLSVFGKGRKMVGWVTRAQWYQTMSKNVSSVTQFRSSDALRQYLNTAMRPLQYYVFQPFKKWTQSILSKPFGQTVTVYNRFMSGQSVQKWVFGLSLLLLLPMGYGVLTYSDVENADLTKLQNWKGGANPEDQRGYVLDAPPIPYGGKPPAIPKQYPVLMDAPVDNNIQTIDLSGGSDEEEDVPTIILSDSDEEEADIKPAKPAKPKPPPKPAVTTRPNNDPCAQLGSKKGWVVQDNVFSFKDNAAARVATIEAKGIGAKSTPRSCFESGASDYVVWLGKIYSSEEAARSSASALEKTMQGAGILKGKLMLRKLN